MKIKSFAMATLGFALASAGCGEQPYSISQTASDLLSGQGGGLSGTLQIPGIPIGTAPGETPSGSPVTFANTNCTLGYPMTSTNPATSVVFNESDVLAAFGVQGLTVSVWYMDEHAMTLGVREVMVTSAAGTTTTNYPVSALSASPSNQSSPQVGSTLMTGDQAGTDTSTCAGTTTCGRPMWPSLFVTDMTADPTSHAGDWQFGGTAIPPNMVYGSWKAAVKTVDNTKTPAVVTVVPDGDPAKNNWNLGTGILAPTTVANEGFGAMVSWNVGLLGLQSGHIYRLQFIVHDGDQHFTGGDTGQNCVNIQIP